MSESKRQTITSILNAIELRLREINHWDETRPSSEALGSSLPFCCDQLEIESWLQFVFIGRMRELLEQGDHLPESCAIHPYLEMISATERRLDDRLIHLIKTIDQEINLKNGSGERI
ncbi:YqcC family protein [Litorivicinus sp.]|nr:YqcC family protein [Litorivicinus sp.]